MFPARGCSRGGGLPPNAGVQRLWGRGGLFPCIHPKVRELRALVMRDPMVPQGSSPVEGRWYSAVVGPGPIPGLQVRGSVG